MEADRAAGHNGLTARLVDKPIDGNLSLCVGYNRTSSTCQEVAPMRLFSQKMTSMPAWSALRVINFRQSMDLGNGITVRAWQVGCSPS